MRYGVRRNVGHHHQIVRTHILITINVVSPGTNRRSTQQFRPVGDYDSKFLEEFKSVVSCLFPWNASHTQHNKYGWVGMASGQVNIVLNEFHIQTSPHDNMNRSKIAECFSLHYPNFATDDTRTVPASSSLSSGFNLIGCRIDLLMLCLFHSFPSIEIHIIISHCIIRILLA